MNTNAGGVSAISDGLGGLPDAVWAGPNGGSLYYTAGQMRAYAAEQVAAEREQMRALIADDAWALTFQTFGQYRSALLRALTPNAL